MMSMQRVAFNKMLICAAAVLGLAGCSGGNDDLRAWIDQMKARSGGRIEPLPQVRPPQRPSTHPKAVQAPDPNRPREFLERFSLDTLRMVGTLEQGGAWFGLVQDSEGLIHRVQVGNHMGQNYGRILSITENQIALVEIIPDGLGGYLERPAAVSLSD